MLKKLHSDIVVIGGSAAGLVAAMTAKNNYPGKEVMVIRKEEQVMIPCGIPYIFGTLGSSSKNVLPDNGLHNLGVQIKIDTVINIDPKKHTLETIGGSLITYEKLIMAIGSRPFIPHSLIGTELDHVFTIPKNKEYLDELHKKLSRLQKIAVVGAGFIGVELSDELVKSGKDVTLFELEDHILNAAFDPDTATLAERILTERGVTVMTGVGVSEIRGEDKVEQLVLSDNTIMDFDAVVLTIGYKANVELAIQSGISVNKQGQIKVDSYMRTHQEDIFACGDCAQKRDFITGRIINLMLASTACAEARIAAMNLYELSTIKTFNGTIGIYATTIDGTVFGVAGTTEEKAKKDGFKVVSGLFKGMDRHPGTLNNPHYQQVKLIVNETGGLIIGGEIVGGISAGELTNVLGFIIQSKMTVSDLLCSQIGTQPMITASPAAYPLIKAAEVVYNKLRC